MPLYLRLLFAFGAGLLVAAGFAPADYWPLAIVGTAGLFGLIELAPTRRHAAALGWWWGLGMFAASLTWIATAFTYQAAMPAAMGWVTVVLLSMFLALYPMLAALLARGLVGGGWPRLLVLAGAFMVTEWLRGVLLSGFAWNPLGAVWMEAPGIVQMAQFGGAQGLSGLMVLAGGALWFMAAPGHAAKLRRQGVALVGVLVLCGAAGASLEQEVYYPDNPLLVIVQPNIGQDVKYEPGANGRHLETYLAMTAAALNGGEAGEARTVAAGTGEAGATAAEAAGMRATDGAGRPVAAPNEGIDGAGGAVPDSRPLSEMLARADPGERRRLVMWSESAVFGLPEEDLALRMKLASVLGPRDLLIFGGVAANRDARGEVLTLGNSLFVLDARGVLRARYDKAHLTPLGEYLPMRPLMERIGLARLAPGGIDFTPGPGPRTLVLPGIPPFGAMICYEIIFGARVTEYGQRPAWIANISNDAWFGPTGPPQHLALARLRAIEEGLPIARATPTGMSAVIGPRGRVFGSLPLGTSGTLALTLPPPLPATLYANTGDAMPLGMALVLVLAGVGLSRRWHAR